MSERITLHKFMRASALYPVSLSYLSAVAAIILVVAGVLSVQVAITALGALAVVIVLLFMRRDLDVVHKLVNSQHDLLVVRIDELTAALISAGVTVPSGAEHPKSEAAQRSHPE